MKKIIGRDLYKFVSEHQGCSAEEAAEGLGTDLATVKSVFRNTQRPQSQNPLFRTTKDGVDHYRAGLMEALQVAVKDLAKSPLEIAIQGLVKTIAASVRKAVDAELDNLIQDEVDDALADMQNRIRAKILVPVVAPPDDMERPKKPATLVKAAIAKAKAIDFSGPIGNVVTNDTLSTRTSHKEKPVAPAPSVVEAEPVLAVKQKVVIVGIHNNKQGMIRSEYGDQIDLRMLNPDQHGRIKNTVSAGDKVLMMVDFVGHKHLQTLEAINADITLCRCGLTGLREELNLICGEQQ